MGATRTAVTVPVPEIEDCGDCARLVHDYLKDQPGVVLVAIDRARREARIELGTDAPAEAQVAGLLRAALAGAARRPSLAEAHRAHDGDTAREARAKHDHTHTHEGLHDMALSNRRRLLVAAGLGAVVVGLQVAGGVWSGSLLLLSDAAHMSTDLASILLAAWAVHIAARPATPEKSFGWHRSEIVAAFVNALGLWVVSAVFIVEAVRRLRAPPDVDGRVVLGVGIVSLAVNVALAVLLARGSGRNLNIRSAYVHVLGDVLGSVGAILAGAAVLFLGWRWADPVFTLLVTAILVAWTWRLTRQTLHILLEGTPEDTDTAAIRRDVLSVPGVDDLHDLHVWSLTTGVHSMSAHVVVSDAASAPEVTRGVRAKLHAHGLDHVTLEIEPAGTLCAACE
ncbi:MAG TPA: cation diffusion facilitator family transporter [Candidatus Thermoplasmatota archaeon]|nr:cation diffusion facilitator family transporter [Candidatus Thermoplasmatota archaeon]